MNYQICESAKIEGHLGEMERKFKPNQERGAVGLGLGSIFQRENGFICKAMGCSNN